MAIYSLHEMAGLLKTGLWQGGEVEKLGYIGTADRRLLLAKLEDILADRRNPYLWSHNLYKRNSFGIERRYDTGHSSMWGGRIAAPRQSKFFGR